MIEKSYLCSHYTYAQLFPHLLQIYRNIHRNTEEIKSFRIVPVFAKDTEDLNFKEANLADAD